MKFQSAKTKYYIVQLALISLFIQACSNRGAHQVAGAEINPNDPGLLSPTQVGGVQPQGSATGDPDSKSLAELVNDRDGNKVLRGQGSIDPATAAAGPGQQASGGASQVNTPEVDMREEMLRETEDYVASENRRQALSVAQDDDPYDDGTTEDPLYEDEKPVRNSKPGRQSPEIKKDTVVKPDLDKNKNPTVSKAKKSVAKQEKHDSPAVPVSLNSNRRLEPISYRNSVVSSPPPVVPAPKAKSPAAMVMANTGIPSKPATALEKRKNAQSSRSAANDRKEVNVQKVEAPGSASLTCSAGQNSSQTLAASKFAPLNTKRTQSILPPLSSSTGFATSDLDILFVVDETEQATQAARENLTEHILEMIGPNSALKILRSVQIGVLQSYSSGSGYATGQVMGRMTRIQYDNKNNYLTLTADMDKPIQISADEMKDPKVLNERLLDLKFAMGVVGPRTVGKGKYLEERKALGLDTDADHRTTHHLDLYSVERALTTQVTAYEYNHQMKGFFRPQAALAIVFVSGHEDVCTSNEAKNIIQCSDLNLRGIAQKIVNFKRQQAASFKMPQQAPVFGIGILSGDINQTIHKPKGISLFIRELDRLQGFATNTVKAGEFHSLRKASEIFASVDSLSSLGGGNSSAVVNVGAMIYKALWVAANPRSVMEQQVTQQSDASSGASSESVLKSEIVFNNTKLNDPIGRPVRITWTRKTAQGVADPNFTQVPLKTCLVTSMIDNQSKPCDIKYDWQIINAGGGRVAVSLRSSSANSPAQSSVAADYVLNLQIQKVYGGKLQNMTPNDLFEVEFCQ